MQLTMKSGTFPDFTYGGETFAASTNAQNIDYSDAGAITFGSWTCVYQIGYYTQTSAFPTFRYEIQILYNNTVYATTGQVEPHRTDNSIYHRFSLPSNLSITDPFHDGRQFTLRFIVRIDNSIKMQKDVSLFSYPTTSGITLSYTNPMQTGRIGNVAVTSFGTNSKATLTVQVGAYAHDNASGTKIYNYWYAFLSDGVTVIGNNFSCATALTGFTFYVPYYSFYTHTYNDGIVTFSYKFDTSDNFSVASKTVDLIISGLTWSYIDQTDSNTYPTISGVVLTENPIGISTTYGKYLGGGISTLTFAYSASFKYGASVKNLTYNLYDAATGTLVDSWSSTRKADLVYKLENTDDITYYLDILLVDSWDGTATYRYSNIQTYGYEYPNIISFNASRCNQDGSPNDAGSYCKISYQFKIYALGNNNSKEVTLTAPDGSHVYTNLDYDHGTSYQYICAADIEHSYTLSIVVEDNFMNVSASRGLSTAGVIMDFLYDGKGIGLGKVAETTQMVEVNPDWTFKADKMTFKGQDLETILTSLGYVFPT